MEESKENNLQRQVFSLFETLKKLESTKKQNGHSLFENRNKANITWSHINFRIGSNRILDNCWGHVLSGQVCAIMGSSGAGKVLI